jgi:DNA primase
MNNLLSLLSVVIGNPGRNVRKENEHIFFCPFCNHYKPKLQVNITSQFWHCWVCDSKGRRFYQLFKKLNATPSQLKELSDIVGEFFYTDKKLDKEEVISLPKEYISLWGDKSSSILKKHALSYLNKRNISYGDIIKYQIGYCDEGLYSNRIIIPSYDENMKLNYFIARDFYSSYSKYKNPPVSKNIIVFDSLINWNEPIILCEGVFDAISIKRNAIPLLGKNIPRALLEKIINKNIDKVYLALDADAISEIIKITEMFSKYNIDVVIIKLKEDTDPSDIGFEEMLTYVKNSKSSNFTDQIKMKLNNI